MNNLTSSCSFKRRFKMSGSIEGGLSVGLVPIKSKVKLKNYFIWLYNNNFIVKSKNVQSIKYYFHFSFSFLNWQFEADILRFSLHPEQSFGYKDFKKLLAEKHGFESDSRFLIWYTDPSDGDLLPINNDSNFEKALVVTRVLLRIFLQKRGKFFFIPFMIHLKLKTKSNNS